jgi:hypothetical protein
MQRYRIAKRRRAAAETPYVVREIQCGVRETALRIDGALPAVAASDRTEANGSREADEEQATEALASIDDDVGDDGLDAYPDSDAETQSSFCSDESEHILEPGSATTGDFAQQPSHAPFTEEEDCGLPSDAFDSIHPCSTTSKMEFAAAMTALQAKHNLSVQAISAIIALLRTLFQDIDLPR